MTSSSNSKKSTLFLRDSSQEVDLPQDVQQQSSLMDRNQAMSSSPIQTSQIKKRRRRAAGTPREGAEVVVLTPEEILATDSFICEICKEGYQRKQNLLVHMRTHDVSTKLIRRDPQAGPYRRKAYVCPVPECVYHDPSRALGDITGVKKHYSRTHCEKQFFCPACPRAYALSGDLKAHSKTCYASLTKSKKLMVHEPACDVHSKDTMHASSTESLDASSESPRFVSNTPKEFIESAMPFNKFTSLITASGEYHESVFSKPPLNTSAQINNSSPSNEFTLSNSTSSNTTSNTFNEILMHASSLNTFPHQYNTSHACSSRISNSLNSCDIISKSISHEPSLNVASFSTIPRSSLTNIDDFPSKQLDIEDIYSDIDVTDILSLSKDHPMLKQPTPSMIHSSPLDIPSSTYNFNQSSIINNFKH